MPTARPPAEASSLSSGGRRFETMAMRFMATPLFMVFFAGRPTPGLERRTKPRLSRQLCGRPRSGFFDFD